MHVIHQKVIDCSVMTAAECSNICLAALQHGPNFKLKADASDDVLHGGISIVHNHPPEPHEITVEIYEEEDLPLAGRLSTFQRPDPMPTEQTIINRLEAM